MTALQLKAWHLPIAERNAKDQRCPKVPEYVARRHGVARRHDVCELSFPSLLCLLPKDDLQLRIHDQPKEHTVTVHFSKNVPSNVCFLPFSSILQGDYHTILSGLAMCQHDVLPWDRLWAMGFAQHALWRLSVSPPCGKGQCSRPALSRPDWRGSPASPTISCSCKFYLPSLGPCSS